MTVTALEHVLVLSDDIEATRQFYCRAVGLRVGERPPLAFPGYWLYAGATPCLHVADRGAYLRHAGSLGLPTAAGDQGGASVDHIAFNAADVERVKEQLERTGVAAVHNTVPNGGPHQVFIEDPNGVRIEINVSSGPVP
jgi:catechol 2,3-dioxygenase-like lactoylglutathione lyase family enzyme